MINIDIYKNSLARYMRAWLGGEEVSARCWGGKFPDRPGIVSVGIVNLYKLDKEGKRYMTKNGYAQKRCVGLVRWEFAKIAPPKLLENPKLMAAV